MSKTEHFKGYSIVKDGVSITLDLQRFNGQLENAQRQLDHDVMNSMARFMPMQTGTFINRTRAESEAIAGTGQVVAGAGPMGRFLYYGKKMVDKDTGKGARKIPTGPGEFVWRYRKGAKLMATDEPLSFSKHAHPDVQAEWFEAAKQQDGKAWIADVKRIAGGGTNG